MSVSGQSGIYPTDPMAALARKLASAQSPTVDLYFRFALEDELAAGRITELAPTVFQAGGTVVVFRHDAGLRQRPRAERVIYVIDDDWRAGLREPTLGYAYRTRMSLLEGRAARRLEPMASEFVVSSSALAQTYRTAYPTRPTAILSPYWPRPGAALPRSGSPIRTVAYLAAQTHGADFRFLHGVLHDLLQAAPDIVLTVSGNHALPRAMQGHPAVRIVPAMSWRAYCAWMRGQRFDLGLHPMLDTAFNAARSANKLIEYDQFGAAVVTTPGAFGLEQSRLSERAVVLEPREDRWRDGLRALLEAPATAHARADANRRAIENTHTREKQRQFWTDKLGLST